MLKFLIIALIFSISYKTAEASELYAEGSVVIEAGSRKVIYSDSENKRLPMASTTKIMTAVVALENAKLDDVIEVSENAQNQEGSRIYLLKGNTVTMEELLYGLMLNSGNDAAVAIAEDVGGNVENFVAMMNEKAMELGLKNTHFTNPSGLPDEEHYSSAYDMAVIMAYAMENDDFARITGTKEYQINLPQSITYLKNHNKLLWRYDGCIGGKTGFTKTAGRCLVSCAERDGVRLVAVTLNDRNDWLNHQEMFDAGFEAVKREKIIKRNDLLCTRIINGIKVNILSGEDVYASLYKGKKNGLVCRIKLSKNISETDYGTKLGYAEIYSGKYKLSSIPLISGTYTEEKYTIFSEFKRIFAMTLFN